MKQIAIVWRTKTQNNFLIKNNNVMDRIQRKQTIEFASSTNTFAMIYLVATTITMHIV